MTLSLPDFFILASILQGAFLALAIRFAPALRSQTNNFLAYFMLLLSALTLLGWQEWEINWFDWIWSLMWEFLLPVLLFQYFLRVLDHPYLKSSWLPWLYAPFFVILVADLVFDGDFVFDLYVLPIDGNGAGYRFYDGFLDTLALWWNIFVIGWAYALAFRDTAAPLVKRRWLHRFGLVMIIVLGVWFIADYMEARAGVANSFVALWIALACLFWYIAYAGVYQLKIVDERAEIVALRNAKPSAEKEETAAAGSAYTDALRHLMEEEHLYRNPDLGRNVVAEKLGISEGYLSQIMSAQVGRPFADYVNAYRIDEAQRLLSSPEFSRYSLEAIGLEAGFKSRSAFYTGFKKATGATPGMYRKQQEAS